MKGDYKMQEAVLISLVVTNKVKIVMLSAKQRLYYAESITLNVLKPDMTKIINSEEHKGLEVLEKF